MPLDASQRPTRARLALAGGGLLATAVFWGSAVPFNVVLLRYFDPFVLTSLRMMLSVAILTVFILGLSLILSVLNVYFRDVQYLVGAIVLQALFYLTPVVYPIDLVYDAIGDRKWLERLYTANPTVQFIEAFHRVLYDLRWPTWQNWVYLLGWSAFSLVFGMSVFRRYETRLAEEL